MYIYGVSTTHVISLLLVTLYFRSHVPAIHEVKVLVIVTAY